MAEADTNIFFACAHTHQRWWWPWGGGVSHLLEERGVGVEKMEASSKHPKDISAVEVVEGHQVEVWDVACGEIPVAVEWYL